VPVKPKKEKPAWPRPITNALQGITYWIGLNRSRDKSHKLSEGALVDELRSLIAGGMRDGESLGREIWYHDLLEKIPSATWRSVFGNKPARADIVLTAEEKIYVLEIKRYGNSINEDLNRLALLRKFLPNCRTALVVIAEREFPKKFARLNGLPRQDMFGTKGDRCLYEVSRVCKASSSLREAKRDLAHYACLLEVWP
jgi:hypothetical protein